MEFPPPEMSMPPPNFHPHSNFHQPRPFHPGGYHHKPSYKSKYGMQVQDDFDGKRLRKSVMRKTVDYNSSIVKAIEVKNPHRGCFFWNLLTVYLFLESSLAARSKRSPWTPA